MDSSLVPPGKKGQDDKMIANLSSTAFKIMITMAFHTTQPFMLLTLHGVGRCTSNYSNRLATQRPHPEKHAKNNPMKSSSIKKKHLIHSHSMYQNHNHPDLILKARICPAPSPPQKKKNETNKIREPLGGGPSSGVVFVTAQLENLQTWEPSRLLLRCKGWPWLQGPVGEKLTPCWRGGLVDV